MSLMIDYVTMPPKTQEAGNMNQADRQRMDSSQQQFAAQVEADVKQQSESTIRKADTENEPNRYDTEREGGGRGGSAGQGKKKKKDSEKKKKKQDDGHFDMFI